MADDTSTDTAPKPGAGATPPPREDTSSTKSGRPTTREGRRAAAEAARIRRESEARKKAERKPDKDKPKAAKATPRRASLETRLSSAIASLGTGVAVGGLAMGNQAVQLDGASVIEHGPGLAQALDRLAKDDPRVAAALERMLTAGAWSGVVMASTPLLVAIAANHGLVPAQLAASLTGNPEQTAPEPPPASNGGASANGATFTTGVGGWPTAAPGEPRH